MELTRQIWAQADVAKFQEYLISCGRPDKVVWTKNIINTEMPVLAILSPVIKDIVTKISKGNFMSFLDLGLWNYFENTSINGNLIMKIKDFDIMKKYLIPYCNKADNWATCDLLAFNVNDKNQKQFWDLSLELIKSDKPFVRRVGVNIWFKFIEREGYLPLIFEKINSMHNETEYYVNMVIAWLIAECFAKNRALTLDFYKNNNLNTFAINKSISKCRDSFRISKEDKDMLLQFKK